MSASGTAYLLIALAAAGPVPGGYDGWWVAGAPAMDACPAANLRIFVEDGLINGTVVIGQQSLALQGEISEDGNALISAVGFFAQASFGENGVELSFRDACGQRRAIGDRVEAQ